MIGDAGDSGGETADWPACEDTLTGPLAGLRVLDLSQVLAGPFATMQLSDLGADVIKVERAGAGDEARRFGPPFLDDGTATYFLAANRDKRSLTLNLADQRAAGLGRRLAVCADVVVDNFLSGRMARFGLESRSLRAENSRLITATVTSFGRGNEYADRPGFDFLAQAMGGMMAVTGPPGGEPTRVGVAIADIAAGLYLSQAIMAALYARERQGRGTHVEVSLLDVQVALLVNLAAGWLQSGAEVTRFGNVHPSIAPYETFDTIDGTLALAVGTDPQFRRLVTALDSPDLADDPRFATNACRVSARTQLRGLLQAQLSERTRAEWLRILVEANVPVAPVNDLADVFADPVIRERMVGDCGDVIQVLSPLLLGGNQPRPRRPPPILGADTDDILQRMGISEAEIAVLRTEGAL